MVRAQHSVLEQAHHTTSLTISFLPHITVKLLHLKGALHHVYRMLLLMLAGRLLIALWLTD